MGNKPRSYININSHVLNNQSIRVLNVRTAIINESLTTNSLDTEKLLVNGNDVTEVLRANGNLNATDISANSATIKNTLTADNIITNSAGVILASGNLISNTLIIDLNNVPVSQYSSSSIAKNSASSHIGYICVSLTDNTNLTGSIALYTRGKMWNLTVYTVIFEKNTNSNSTINLNTENGSLTIKTNNNINFEIKALNLFEK